MMEPIVLPKQLLLLDFIVYTHWQRFPPVDLCFVNTQPGLPYIVLTFTNKKKVATLAKYTAIQSWNATLWNNYKNISYTLFSISSLVCLHNCLPSYSRCMVTLQLSLLDVSRGTCVLTHNSWNSWLLHAAWKFYIWPYAVCGCPIRLFSTKL